MDIRARFKSYFVFLIVPNHFRIHRYDDSNMPKLIIKSFQAFLLTGGWTYGWRALQIKEFHQNLYSYIPGTEGTLGCLLYLSLKFYNNVFLFVGLTTLGTEF